MNDYYKKDTITDPSEWLQLVNLLDLDEFNKIDIDKCAVFYDGCEMWIHIDSVDLFHQIRFDYYRNYTIVDTRTTSNFIT